MQKKKIQKQKSKKQTQSKAPKIHTAGLTQAETDILEFLALPGYQPLRSRDLARRMNIPDNAYSEFRLALSGLQKSGKVARRQGGRWGLVLSGRLVEGVMELKRGGFGFVIPDDPKVPDVYIPEDLLAGAWDGDRVAVLIEKPHKGEGSRRFGQVAHIIERALKRVVGRISERNGKQVCIMDDPRFEAVFAIAEDSLPVKLDDKALLDVDEWPIYNRQGSGRIIERLGPAGKPQTEVAAILLRHKAPGEYPAEAVAQARACKPGFSDEERAQRLDLREVPCVTIDPADARDFDDAISVERIADGHRIGVHIADVSHYVTPGSLLDQEARERSTSIYLPDRVIPMLPPELSNDICSLRPDEERPTLSVFMDINDHGEIGKSTIARCIIRSRKRLTYEEARDILSDEKVAAEFPDKEVLSLLRQARTVAEQLRAKRFAQGSIELCLPERKVVVNADGEAVAMRLVEHDFSHQLVEDFMLAANVALARYAAKAVLPILYRVHDEPDRDDLMELSEFMAACGLAYKPPFDRKRLNDILGTLRGKPEEQSVNMAVLTSMRQAVYSPERREHYALAFPLYTHFTSPIRRYPDMYLHQVLKNLFQPGKATLPANPPAKKGLGAEAELVALGIHTSGMERKAMRLEGDVVAFRRLELLKKSERKQHTAIVTGIKDFGVFVELQEFFCESLITRDELARHGLSAIECLPNRKAKGVAHVYGGKNKGFHLGEKLVVEVTEINMSERRCKVAYVDRA